MLLNCGHEPSVRDDATRSVGTGYGTIEGYQLCYDCCEQWEVFDFTRATVYSGYVNETTRKVTTWTGGKLATITAVRTDRRMWTGNGSYRMRHVWATGPGGSRWYGKASHEWDLVTLRRVKS
jgi:hypothetical protein